MKNPVATFRTGMDFLKRFPIIKVDEATHYVWGVAASETPDTDEEICDYDAAKAAIKKWSDDTLAKTAAAGQDPSLGNVRVMHQLQIGGKATKIEYHDDTKQIWVGSEPANDEVWHLLKGGFLTGMSIGGDYAWRRPEGKFLRYAPVVGEISYVDRPANSEASFSYVKADGTTELRKFAKAGETEEKLIAELKKREFSDEQRKKLAESGAALPDGSFPIVNGGDLENAIQAIGRAKDPDKAKAHIRARAKALGLESKIPDSWKASYRESLQKQIDELEAALKAKKEKHMTVEELQKASREALIAKVEELQKAHVPVLDHLKNMHKAAAEHHDEMCKAHGAHLAAMQEHIDKCMKSFGHEGLPPHKAAEAGALTKADIDAAVKKALEAAKGEGGNGDKLTKADLDKAVAEALEKAKPADPTGKVKLVLVDREGKEVGKGTDAQVVPQPGEDLSKSVGF